MRRMEHNLRKVGREYLSKDKNSKVIYRSFNLNDGSVHTWIEITSERLGGMVNADMFSRDGKRYTGFIIGDAKCNLVRTDYRYSFFNAIRWVLRLD